MCEEMNRAKSTKLSERFGINIKVSLYGMGASLYNVKVIRVI